jgi:hypothetical protein
MAKRKRSSNRPQPQHKKSSKSQHDKRKRLNRRNANRRKTSRARVPLAGFIRLCVLAMQTVMDRRVAFRLGIIAAGMLLANDTRTASAWFTAAGVHDDWDRFYECLISVGRCSGKLGTVVLGLLVRKFTPKFADRILIGMDDSPTARYGQHVEGAGVHHNPTPGPADGTWLNGHNWVTLAWLGKHPLWGVIAFPVRSLLYVRKVDVAKLREEYAWEFRTKHQLGLELLTWFMQSVRALGVEAKIWLVIDGGYSARPFLKPTVDMGIVVVGRLRKDACVFDLPPEGSHGNRIYGGNRLHLAKRAAHTQGWETMTYDNRGKAVTRQYKTFLATSQLISRVIRVVILRHDDGGWAPYFCTDESASVQDILEAVAARWAIEEHFHDVKEVWGAGQQQVRNIWSNIGCWNLNQWMYTLVELGSWDVDKSELSDRSDRPWDNQDRRPSHADRRQSISREMLTKEFLAGLPDDPNTEKMRAHLEALISLVA